MEARVIFVCLCVVAIVRGEQAPTGLCRANERLLMCGCPRTCRDPAPNCAAVCRAGCFCEDGQVRNDKGLCVNLADCPPILSAYEKDTSEPRPNGGKCPENEEYRYCEPCNKTCDQPNPMCPAQCSRGCFCKNGLLRDRDGSCVIPDKCSKSPNATQHLAGWMTCGEHQVYKRCETMQKTCSEPVPWVPSPCVMGCFCEEGYVKSPNGQCVKLEECPIAQDQETPAQANNDAATAAQAKSGLVILAQAKTGLAISARAKTGLSTPAQTKSGTVTLAQAKTGLTTPAQAKSGLVTLAQAKSGLSTPAQAKTGLSTPAQVKSGLVTPAQAKTGPVTFALAKTGQAISAQAKTHLVIPVQAKTRLEIPAQEKTVLAIPAHVKLHLRVNPMFQDTQPSHHDPSVEDCAPDEEYFTCGWCEPSCSQPSPYCPNKVCNRGCLCRPPLLRHHSGYCVEAKECFPVKCKDPNEEYVCLFGCELRCDKHCVRPRYCVLGCYCRIGLLRDSSGLCVVKDKCSNSTEANVTAVVSI